MPVIVRFGERPPTTRTSSVASLGRSIATPNHVASGSKDVTTPVATTSRFITALILAELLCYDVNSAQTLGVRDVQCCAVRWLNGELQEDLKEASRLPPLFIVRFWMQF